MRKIIANELLPTYDDTKFRDFMTRHPKEYSAEELFAYSYEIVTHLPQLLSRVIAPMRVDMENLVPMRRDQMLSLEGMRHEFEDAFKLLNSGSHSTVLNKPEYDSLRAKIGSLDHRGKLKVLEQNGMAIINDNIKMIQIYNDEFHKDQQEMLDMMDAFIADHEQKFNEAGNLNRLKQ